MKHLRDKDHCCGCTACAAACPRDAIMMQADAEGFPYPVLDEGRCIDCGLCDKVCQFHEGYEKNEHLPEPLAYAVRHKDETQLTTSRSGAAFVALSDWILQQGGVVYGAGYEDGGTFRVIHKRAATPKERDEFKGSKYVQSDLTGIFPQVKRDLQDGLLVLFSGTPCYTAGLNAYVGKTLRERLYLVDIVCHGVPSPFFWRDYLMYAQSRWGVITSVEFRDKSRVGWKGHEESISFGKKKVFSTIYTQVFYRHIILRRSCGNCVYCNYARPSDCTLADYWGWERTDKTFNADNKGCSLVFCNTEKGRAWFDAIKKDVHYLPAELINTTQGHLQRPTQIPKDRDAFFECYLNQGIEKALKKYGFVGWRKEVRKLLNLAKRIYRKAK